jgi:hypothetical protein
VVPPALLPLQGCSDKFFEAMAAHEVVERPPRRNVSDHKDTGTIVTTRDIVQEPAMTLDRLAPALSLWKRDIESR